MNRRSAVKNLFISSGAMITLPSWMMAAGLAENTNFSTSFTDAEQLVLAAVCNTIIPPGNAVGALSVGVDKYLQKLFDDCYEPAARDEIKVQLTRLQSSSRSAVGKNFTDLDSKEQSNYLNKLSASGDKKESDFFKLIKMETIRGFTTSQQVMVKYLGYKTAPGHYYGSVDAR